MSAIVAEAQGAPIAASRVAVRDWMFVAGAAAVIAFTAMQVLSFGYGRDQGGFAMVAHTIRGGGLPYRDVWDFKPPLIYYIYLFAEIAFGRQASAIRVLELASFAAMVGACIVLSREYMDDARAGVLAGAFACLSIAQLNFWHTAQAETFGAPFVLWGMAFAALSDRSQWRFTNWFASGIMYGAATLLKPTIGIAGVGTIAVEIVGARRRGDSWRQIGRVAGTWAAGVVLPLAACVGYFFARGALWDVVTAARFAQGYAAQAWSTASAQTIVASLIGTSLFHSSIFNGTGLLALAMLTRVTPRMVKGLAHAAAVVVLLLIGVTVQMRFFFYHFGAVLPVIALLAGWGWWALWKRLRSDGINAALVAVLVILTVIWSPNGSDWTRVNQFLVDSRDRIEASLDPAARQLTLDRLYSDREYLARDNRLTATWISGHTQPGDRVFIYGFTPEIYAAANREPASRYIYDHALRLPATRASARRELMAELTARAPAVIVVEHNDVMTFVNGEGTDSANDLETFSELVALLNGRYTLAARLGRFDLYTRSETRSGGNQAPTHAS